MYYFDFFKRLLSSLVIGGQAINFIFKGKISKNDLFDQLMESGPGSLLIVLITGIAAGTVFNIQVASQLTSMGVSSEIGGLLAVGMAREMAPLLTATLMTGKVATAYAAQLGTMKVTEQIEAITMLRTEPVQYLVVPRLLSMVIMSPIQCLLFLSVATDKNKRHCIGDIITIDSNLGTTKYWTGSVLNMVIASICSVTFIVPS